jgi:hypothetical protein
MLANPSVTKQQNGRPLNQVARRRLQEAKAAHGPTDGLFVLSLALWALEKGVQVPPLSPDRREDLKGHVERMCGLPADQVMRWLERNPAGEQNPKEQAELLRQALADAPSPEAAAQALLEEISSHLQQQFSPANLD